MRFWYSIEFRCGIAVFVDFLLGIAGLGTPQCPLLTHTPRRLAFVLQ